MNAALYRLRQGVLALDAGFRPAPALTPEIDTLLTEAQRAAWCELPEIERAHLARVGHILVTAGHQDSDLLIAAVFHDIGKHGRRGSVRLPHRVIWVLVKRLVPSVIDHLRGSPHPPWLLRPLWLCVHHPQLGAECARALGCSERACWLIAHHEDAPPVADRDLAALQWADNQA